MKQYLYNLATDKSNGPLASFLKLFLFLLSLIYLSVVKILSAWQLGRNVRLDCKVISVGNITLGGTGKTTLVEYIAATLKKEGRKIAILTRGYGKQSSSHIACRTAYETMGDEPFMLASNLGNIPVIVDSNRIRGAWCAIKDYKVDTVILDDGFQQWKIKKDLEITAIDAGFGFGNCNLLPRGLLREPLSALKRSDIFLFTKVNLSQEIEKIEDLLKKINAKAKIFTSIHQPIGFYLLGERKQIFELNSLQGKNAVIFSGIGDPLSFESLLLNLGVRIVTKFSFDDHYHYRQEDLQKIFQVAQEKQIDTIITTEKDAARISYLKIDPGQIRILVLRIELKIKENEEEFRNRLLKLYRL